MMNTSDTLMERCDRIPDDLIALDQWVTWRNENGTKVPYRADGRGRAKVNDPGTWFTFQAALQSFADRLDTPEQFTGIGFVFTEDDDFVGIDLDDCVNGDEIKPSARAIIDLLNGYAEISPSLTGVKVWVRGRLNLPTTGKKQHMSWGGDMEVYHRGRWFAVTGREMTR